MNDEELQALFASTDKLAPSAEARQRARSAAMAAFTAAQGSVDEQSEKNATNDQGNANNVRPMADTNVIHRRKVMQALSQKWVFSGLASAAVLVLAVAVLFQVSQPGGVMQHQDLRQQDSSAMADKESHNYLEDSPLEEVVVTAQRKEERLQSAPIMTREFAKMQTAEADRALNAPMDHESMKHESMEHEPMKHEPMKPVPQTLPASEGFASTARVGALIATDALVTQGYKDVGRDRFAHTDINSVKQVADEPVSTFSIDVDTASYSFVRRQLNQGVLPPKDAVRVEEMVNYFDYDYPLPANRAQPFKTTAMVSDAPWKPGNKLLQIGIRGYDLDKAALPASNLVFLLDVSGSMNSPDKLPLVKQSMGLLLSQLKATDTVAIVAYAGAAGVVLEPTAVADKQKILAALERLNAGGSTAGGEGIKLAYQLAASHFDKAAVNRVILATDGDFNVGITNREELKGFVERKREEGIYLSVLGFGEGNYQDELMQALAQNGNGVAAYIDTLGEAQKVLVDEATSTLFPIANDVKIQVEFNPATVSEYRLLGYETRALNREDFNNDRVDAGDIGAGHRVTALYEITPKGANSGLLEPSRYQQQEADNKENANEYAFVKIRYKRPGEKASQLITTSVAAENSELSPSLTQERDFATAVASFAELLRGGRYNGNWQYQDVIELANKSRGADPYGYRAEFVQLVRKAAVAQDMR